MRTRVPRFIGAASVLLIVGCASASQAGSPGPSAAVAPSAPASAAARATLTPSSPPSVAPSPTASSLPAVGAAPSGPWSRLDWIDAGAIVPLGPTNVSVRGWSGGYVALDQTGGSDENGNSIPVVIRSSASSDGIHWSAPSTVDTAGIVGEIEITQIAAAPSGLLAVGYPVGDTCGGPASVAALWTSSNGTVWRRVSLPKDFRTGQVHTIDGGPAGFIATGSKADGTTQALWTSPDGRTWTSRPLPKVSSGTLVLDGATSFGGGFVLVGAVLGEGGCGGPARVHAATWSSADGAAWTRSTLPGSMTAADASLGVRAISDRVAVVTQSSPDGSKVLAWTSTDGRAWTPVHAPSDQLTTDPVTDGRHAALMMDPDSGSGAPTVFAIGEDAGVTILGQSGNGPIASEDSGGWTFAVGPTGILVVRYDGGAAWLGLPS